MRGAGARLGVGAVLIPSERQSTIRFYVEYKVPDDASKDAGTALHGRRSLERMFLELKSQHDSGTYKLNGLTKFHMFD